MIATISASIAPGIALLSYFYLRDRYQTEPLHLVIKTFIFGLLIVFPVMVLQFGLQEEIKLGIIGKTFLTAGLLEEFFKWFVIYFTVYKHVQFDEPYDGIVYAVAGSLGYASLENFFYLYTYGIQEAFIRALLPVSSHGLFGVTMGYYMGRGKFHPDRRKQQLFLFMSMAAPSLLHGIYDYIYYFSSDHYLWLVTPFMILLWFFSLRRIGKIQTRSKSASF